MALANKLVLSLVGYLPRLSAGLNIDLRVLSLTAVTFAYVYVCHTPINLLVFSPGLAHLTTIYFAQ